VYWWCGGDAAAERIQKKKKHPHVAFASEREGEVIVDENISQIYKR
jgi:hypothetical protein